MTGPRGGVIGVKKEQAIESLRTHMCMRFETSDDDPWLMGVAHPLCAAAAARAGARHLSPWRADEPCERPSSATSTSGRNHTM